MNRKVLVIALSLSLVIIFASNTIVAAKNPPEEPSITLLAAGLEGASGSTVGPDGALYVTEGAAGRVSRVDPQTGDALFYRRAGSDETTSNFGEAERQAFVDRTALRRILEIRDTDGAFLFLASRDSDLVTGQVIVVDGGLVMLG